MSARDLEINLDPVPEAPAMARAAVGAFASAVEPEVLSDLRIVVSELVTNSLVHGPGRPITVRLIAHTRGHVVGEVVDQGEGSVAIRRALPDETGGFGLRILDLIAHDWGVHEGSTHVWFDLRATAGQPVGS